EAPVGRKAERIHVAREDLEVPDTPCGRARIDKALLSTRVRYGGDLRARIMLRHPQRQRSPAAAEFEDPVAVREARAPRRQREHVGFRLIEALRRILVEAARILQLLAEHQFE